jgi:hypothetical protein
MKLMYCLEKTKSEDTVMMMAWLDVSWRSKQASDRKPREPCRLVRDNTPYMLIAPESRNVELISRLGIQRYPLRIQYSEYQSRMIVEMWTW